MHPKYSSVAHMLRLKLNRNFSNFRDRCTIDPCFNGIRGRRSKRVVRKNGDRNVSLIYIPERASQYFRDVVTTLVRIYSCSMSRIPNFNIWLSHGTIPDWISMAILSNNFFNELHVVMVSFCRLLVSHFVQSRWYGSEFKRTSSMCQRMYKLCWILST